ncbi:hypothetical protein [Ferruginibacter sp.]
MNKKYLIFFLLVCAVFFNACNRYYVSSMYPIPAKKLYKRSVKYKERYGKITYAADTILIKRNFCRIYKKGQLVSAGKLNNGRPTSYWITFDDALELEYIISYKEFKTDSFFHPFAIINQNWGNAL